MRAAPGPAAPAAPAPPARPAGGAPPRLRVLVIGDFRGRPDEGLRGISRAVAAGAGERHEVMTLTTREAVSPRTLRAVRGFAPQVVHYVTGPTIRSVGILAAYRRLLGGRCRTVVSAVRPYFSAWERVAARALRPDLVLSQSERWERFFRGIGADTRFVPNGTRTDRFRPVPAAERPALRARYGLPAEGPLVLHVGHLKANRGLDALVRLQEAGFQTVMVAGTAMPADPEVRARLEAAGCIVLHRFLEAIEEVYACADCYVFPVADRPADEFPRGYGEIGVIDTPLSVLEAMACDLPVVSTPFGALPRMFGDVPGLRFRAPDALAGGVAEAMADRGRAAGSLRAAVLPYDWSRVLGEIDAAYRALAPAALPEGATR